MQPLANQANAKSNAESESAAWLIVAAAALRTAFGILMAIDAWLKWQPGFAAHYVGYLQNAANGQPHWLQGWFHMWLRLVTMHTTFFISATRLIETAIAIGLLLGFARRITYFGGALFSLLIWSTAEGFGGPYTSGATNVGPALIYALVFFTAALSNICSVAILTVSITTSSVFIHDGHRWSNGRRNVPRNRRWHSIGTISSP
jgi:nitrite reductase (NO-forming)